MANTVTTFNHGVMISAINEDWAPGIWMPIHSIQFVPGATNDVCVIEDQNDAGARIFYAKSTDGDSRIKYFPDSFVAKPVLDLTDCTLTAGAFVIVITR